MELVGFHDSDISDLIDSQTLNPRFNESLIKEVEQVLQGKRAFCFAKFYKAEHNYTIVQLYIEHEFASSELAKLELYNVPSAPHSPEQTATEDSQLFTPSMSTALEDTPTSVPSSSTDQNTPPSKRALIFGSVTTPALEDLPEKASTELATPPSADGTESPIKKSKSKDRDAPAS